MNNKLEIYTDGSSLGNPGPGGWGVVIVSDGKIIEEKSGGEKQTTNNRMELVGAIEALKYIISLGGSSGTKCDIFTDSTYVLLGITNWVHNWERNGWRTSDKKQVLNQDLWEELSSLNNKLKNKIFWYKVKGHAGHIYNERADELAQGSALLNKGNI